MRRVLTVQLYSTAWQGVATVSSSLSALLQANAHEYRARLGTGKSTPRVQALPTLRGAARPTARIPVIETSECTTAELRASADVKRARRSTALGCTSCTSGGCSTWACCSPSVWDAWRSTASAALCSLVALTVRARNGRRRKHARY